MIPQRIRSTPWLAFTSRLVLLTGIIAVLPSAAHSQPSFDCRKASSAAEKTVCADPGLARLDKQLAAQYKSLVRSFTDEDQIAQIKLDQNHWLSTRNACAAAAECLSKTYRERLSRLTGADRDYPAAGLFEAGEVGTFALYPLAGQYLVSIQTAKPQTGAWTCDVAGHAKMDSGALHVTSGSFSFPAVLRDERTLVVEPGKEVSAAQADACGLNGTFTLSFTRHASPDNH
jgi:uncharacterized protein